MQLCMAMLISSCLRGKKLHKTYQGPVVQSMVSLTSSLMTNSLTVVAKVISNVFIYLLQKKFFFSAKISR